GSKKPGEALCEALVNRSGGIGSELCDTALKLCGLHRNLERVEPAGNAVVPRPGSSRQSRKKRDVR
ncbi:MAG: hypothetical protein OXQ28_11380, partial [Acidobacteriota bacterium]|nr:hypothetical protein [Acidobacteriota bacterium]